MGQAESFGQLFRRFRLAAGLTQKELAERARVSLRTVTNLERPQNARPRGETLILIAEALRLTADERAQIEQHLDSCDGRIPDAPMARGELPTYYTAFIGRDAERTELGGICRPETDVAAVGDVPLLPHGPRLLTLIGAPGFGKTRLAVAVAHDVASAYREGVRFVDLTGLADPDGVLLAVARALGLAAWPGSVTLDSLIAVLQPQQLLIVLDGAAQALDACAAFVDTVLRRCPTAQLVVTSREPLRIEGERAWRVMPLKLPDATAAVGAASARRAALPAIRTSAAVRLFADRAALVVPGFSVSFANVGVLDTICRALGGVPLALELAAAQVASLGLSGLAAQLAALPQEQALSAVIAWSYLRLGPADRALLRYLGTFVGHWTEDAATVCEGLACEDAASGGLRRLVAAGLVQRERHASSLRYRLLRPVRAYALTQLCAAGEEAVAGVRHLAWCLELAQEAAANPPYTMANEMMAAADDNLCHALIWALNHDQMGGRKLTAALRDYERVAQPSAIGWARFLPLLERTVLPTCLEDPEPPCASA